MMIRSIKIIYNKFNVAKSLIKIIDEVQKDNEKLKEECLVFRNRAIEAEQRVIVLEQRERDYHIQRPLGITG